jgi:hypothetical protein
MRLHVRRWGIAAVSLWTVMSGCQSEARRVALDVDALEQRMDLLEVENRALRARLDALPEPEDLADVVHTETLATLMPRSEMAAYATVAQLPDLSPYALKSELPVLPDLSPYALKSELPVLPDLSPYALKSELPVLPDLSPYALKSELPDFGTFVRQNDLSAFDDVVRLISEPTVKQIPGDFATLEDAFDWAQQFSIARNASLTFELADGVYPFDATFVPAHRDGGRISIIGNTDDPSAVVLDFPQGGGINLPMSRLGLIDGVTIRGSRAATGSAASHGVQATEGAVIRLGANVVVENFPFSGLRATLQGHITANGVISRNNGLDGFAVFNSGSMLAYEAEARGNGRFGMNITVGGAVEAGLFTAANNTNHGIRVFANGAFLGNGAVVSSNQDGMQALAGGIAWSDNISSSNNRGNGVHANIGGVIGGANMSAVDNSGSGIRASTGSVISTDASTASGNGGSGFDAWGGSTLLTARATARENTGYGFVADQNSFLGAQTHWNTGVASLSEDNGSAGFTASNGSVLEASSAVSQRNGWDGFSAWNGGVIQANYNDRAGRPGQALDNVGNGFSASSGSVISAMSAVAMRNRGSGFAASNGSALSVHRYLAPPDAEPVAGATASENGNHGFDVRTGASAEGNEAVARDNILSGFNAWGHASWFGFGLRAENNGRITATNPWPSPGINVSSNSWIGTQDAQVSGSSGDGIAVHWASLFESGSSDIEGGQRTRSIDNAIHGISVGLGSHVSVRGIEVGRNPSGGITGGAHAGVEASRAWIHGATEGMGASIVSQSFIALNEALIEDNAFGGLNCGASYCSAPNSILRNNRGGGFAFGLNVFWDGWIDATGAVASGHDADTNLPRENFVEDWGPIYDNSIQPN